MRPCAVPSHLRPRFVIILSSLYRITELSRMRYGKRGILLSGVKPFFSKNKKDVFCRTQFIWVGTASGLGLRQFLCCRSGRIEKVDFRSTIYSAGCVWIHPPYRQSDPVCSFCSCALFRGGLTRGSRTGKSQFNAASWPARGL